MKEEIKRVKHVASSPLRYARRKLGSSPCCGKNKTFAKQTECVKLGSASNSDCNHTSCSKSGASSAISSRLERLAAPRPASSRRGPVQSKCNSSREALSSGNQSIDTHDIPSSAKEVKVETKTDRSVKMSERTPPNSHGGNRRRNKMIPTPKRNSDESSVRVDIPCSTDGTTVRYQKRLTKSDDTSLVGRDEHEAIAINIKPIDKSNNSWEDSLDDFVNRLSCELDSKLVEIDDMKKKHDKDVEFIQKQVKVECLSPISTPTTLCWESGFTNDRLEVRDLHSVRLEVKELQSAMHQLKHEFNDFCLAASQSIKQVNKQLAMENRSLVNYVKEEIRLMNRDKKDADLSTMQRELDDALCENAYLRAKQVSMQDEGTSRISESDRNDNFRSCTKAQSEKQWIPIQQRTCHSWFNYLMRIRHFINGSMNLTNSKTDSEGISSEMTDAENLEVYLDAYDWIECP